VTNKDDRFIRIHVDRFERIAAITYFGRDPVPTDNLQSLIGLHQLYLNRIVDRFDEGLISDFLEYVFSLLLPCK